VFALLLKARELWEQTEGALDITVGPLMRCWGFWGASGALPEPEAVETALASVGQSKLQLDPDRRTVRFEQKGMTVDLGAIGKGYAIDRAVELLRDSGVLSALLHGGTSTAYAMGVPPHQSAWRTAVRITAQSAATAVQPPEVPLEDEALSVSAAAEKSFTVNGRTFGHVIDPRTGWPCDRAELSLVVLPDAVEADAWSTALMVLGADGLERFERSFPGMRGMVVSTDGTARSVGRNAALPGDPAGQ
jgi:thiamine biosynthesis lipoprotein